MNLETYTQYLVSLQVFNPEGAGPNTTVLVMTDEGGELKGIFSIALFVIFSIQSVNKIDWFHKKFTRFSYISIDKQKFVICGMKNIYVLHKVSTFQTGFLALTQFNNIYKAPFILTTGINENEKFCFDGKLWVWKQWTWLKGSNIGKFRFRFRE